MPTFSFDIVSTYDKAEMNNVFSQTQKEIDNRFDFKGTPAAIEWIGDKTGIKIIDLLFPMVKGSKIDSFESKSKAARPWA